MSILINENALRMAYLQETGYQKPIVPSLSYTETNRYIEWLEEKVTEMLQKEEENSQYLEHIKTIPCGGPFDEQL
jgi:hypothetical protein